jgi:GNAT superfamily N-acetyltransferase
VSPVPDSPRVRLVPLDRAAADTRLAASVTAYAATGVTAGWWPAEAAAARAAARLAEILPDGSATDGHRFWAITDDAGVAGWLWVGPRDGGWWIWDIEVDAASRGRGLGAAALSALDDAAREAGVAVIGLHVLRANGTARRLYLRQGFVDVRTTADASGYEMEKRSG